MPPTAAKLPGPAPPRAKAQERPPLSESFDASDCRDEWLLRCKACGEGWRLTKTPEERPVGSLLPLLEHTCPPDGD